jgi:hypothetical protein
VKLVLTSSFSPNPISFESIQGNPQVKTFEKHFDGIFDKFYLCLKNRYLNETKFCLSHVVAAAVTKFIAMILQPPLEIEG